MCLRYSYTTWGRSLTLLPKGEEAEENFFLISLRATTLFPSSCQREKAHKPEGAPGTQVFFFQVLYLLAWGANTLGSKKFLWNKLATIQRHYKVYTDPADKFMKTCTNCLMTAYMSLTRTAHPVPEVIIFIGHSPAFDLGVHLTAKIR